VFKVLKAAGKSFIEDDGTRLAAALAYFTLFTIPPLLVVVTLVSGLLVDASAVTGRAFDELARVVGEPAAADLRRMLANAQRPGSGGVLSWVVGVGALVFGATGAFVQLQGALNKAWRVKPDPAQGGVRSFLLKRLLSLGMVLAIVILLLGSVVASAVTASMSGEIAGVLPGAVSSAFAQALQLGLSAAVFILLVATIFVVLPDAEVAWRDVWVGAVFTGTLLVLGQFLLGLYVATRDPASTFGAAGPIVLLLMLIYLSGVILFFGAEFTQAWAARQGRHIRPEQGAVRVTRVVRDEPVRPVGVSG
jgi:membrane protein